MEMTQMNGGKKMFAHIAPAQLNRSKYYTTTQTCREVFAGVLSVYLDLSQ